MLIKTIKDYRDKETKEVFRKTDKTPREVSEERGAELIELGYAVEVHEVKHSKKKSSKTEDAPEPVENETVETESTEESTEE